MKILYILRHGDAAPPGRGDDDFERVLSAKGRRDMDRLAGVLKMKSYHPDYVLCSPAARTRETLHRALPEIRPDQIYFDPSYYNAAVGQLFEAAQGLPASVQSALIVAHNPGVHGLAFSLAAPENGVAYQTLSHQYAPGTLTVLECPVDDWKDLAQGDNKIRDLIFP